MRIAKPKKKGTSTKLKRLNVDLPEETHAQFKALAAMKRLTLTDFVKLLIFERLARK